jgi:hypothetical protein
MHYLILALEEITEVPKVERVSQLVEHGGPLERTAHRSGMDCGATCDETTVGERTGRAAPEKWL